MWKTNVRTGRAHRVVNRKPECEAPTPQGGITWGPTTRGHRRCPDCLRLDAGKTLADINRDRAHSEALAENTHRNWNT